MDILLKSTTNTLYKDSMCCIRVLKNLIVTKFGGGAIGVDGKSIPLIIKRIKELKKDAKIIAVFSAPLTIHDGKEQSLTDLALFLGKKAESGESVGLQEIRRVYHKILNHVDKKYQDECKKTIELFLEKSERALREAAEKKEFTDVIRSTVLAYSGEILMSHVMDYVLKSAGIRSDVVRFDIWPIITDKNMESANFLASQSAQNIEAAEALLEKNDVLSIGGFIGKTVDGLETTYERGGSDRIS